MQTGINEGEKRAVSRMIVLYCRSRHGADDDLCAACTALEAYGHKRLQYCRFGAVKPSCKKCPTHCYMPDFKLKMREVMRFSGPRMLLRHPADALRHWFRSLR